MESIRKTYIIADTLMSSLGGNTDENLKAIERYRSGIVLGNYLRVSETAMPVALIDENFYSSLQQNIQGDFSRAELLIIQAIREVLRQIDLDISSQKTGLIISTTKGNIDLLTTSEGAVNSSVYLPSLAKKIAHYFNVTREIQIVSNACISGVSSLIIAKRYIESGAFDHVIVVGCDVLSRFITSGFMSFKSISPTRCKPYDTARDGLSLGEACGVMVLSSAYQEGAVVLSGGAISNDANHISGPSRTGYELHLAIKRAMEEAQVSSHDISFVNLHGTATLYNDEMESKAIELSRLSEVPVQSLKGYFGHTLGASGVIESIISIHQLKKGRLWGTLGFETLGTPKYLQVFNKHSSIPMKHCLKTASGFGGCNASVVFSLPEFAQTQSKGTTTYTYSVERRVIIQNSKIIVDGESNFQSEATDFGLFIREAFRSLNESDMKFYKMDNLCKLGYMAAFHLLKDIKYNEEKIAILCANKSSSLDTDLKHVEQINRYGDAGASPSIFVYTLPNVVLGEICIKYKIKGENTFFIAEQYEEQELTEYAKMVLQKNNLDYCIVGWCELYKNNYKADFKLIKQNRYGTVNRELKETID